MSKFNTPIVVTSHCDELTLLVLQSIEERPHTWKCEYVSSRDNAITYSFEDTLTKVRFRATFGRYHLADLFVGCYEPINEEDLYRTPSGDQSTLGVYFEQLKEYLDSKDTLDSVGAVESQFKSLCNLYKKVEEGT